MLFDFRNHIDSPFNLGLFVKGGSNVHVEKYFNDRLYQFCQEMNISTYRLSFEQIFTDVEFNKQIPDENEESFINRHFYTKLFGELRKKWVFDTVKQKDILVWEYKPKICFTLDRSLTPVLTSSGIPYGTLNLGSKPVLYYIWVDVQSIINIIKSF